MLKKYRSRVEKRVTIIVDKAAKLGRDKVQEVILTTSLKPKKNVFVKGKKWKNARYITGDLYNSVDYVVKKDGDIIVGTYGFIKNPPNYARDHELTGGKNFYAMHSLSSAKHDVAGFLNHDK